jgi:hypothetical protein
MAWDAGRHWLFLGLADGALQIFAPAPDFSYCANIGRCPMRSGGIANLHFHSCAQNALTLSSSISSSSSSSVKTSQAHDGQNDMLLLSCGNGAVGLYSPNSQVCHVLYLHFYFLYISTRFGSTTTI